jgi:hypothetical protein
MRAKQEVERLMNELVPFAKRMLAEHGEFFPFGGFMKPDGAIVHVGAEDKRTNEPDAGKLMVMLKTSFRNKARSGECRATGIVVNVRLVPPGGADKCNAIQVNLDHKEGYSAEVFYPYHLDGPQVIYGPIFAQKNDSDIFAERL